MGGEAQTALLTGTTFGRYRIISRLAVGGMAEIWVAQSGSAPGGRPVVLKTILPGLAEAPELVQMFRNEAMIGARLNHPNIVRVLDYGQHGDRYFIAMEYVEGQTLRRAGNRLRAAGQ